MSNTSSVKLFGAQCTVQTVHTLLCNLDGRGRCFAQYPAKCWVFGLCHSSQCVVPLWYGICTHTSSSLVLRLGRPGGCLPTASVLLLSKTLNNTHARLRDLTHVFYTSTYWIQISTGSTPFVGKSRISLYFIIRQCCRRSAICKMIVRRYGTITGLPVTMWRPHALYVPTPWWYLCS